MSPLRHAIVTPQAAIEGEQPAGFDAYQADLVAALQPADAVEEDLVETMLMAQWKLRRLWRQEQGVYLYWRDKIKAKNPDGTYGQINDARHGQMLTRLTRQEAHLMRAYLRAESRLRARRDERTRAQDREQAAAQASQAVRGAARQPHSGTQQAPATGGVGAQRDAPPTAAAQPAATPTPDPHPAAGERAPTHNRSGEAAPQPVTGEDTKAQPIESTDSNQGRISENTNRLADAAD